MHLSEQDIDRMTEAYLTCGLWASTDPDTERPLDDEFGVEDLSAEDRTKARAQCAAFVATAGPLLQGLDAAQVGHDFWLTRNRHGAGFWDRGLGLIGTQLTDLCRPYGECHIMPYEVVEDGVVTERRIVLSL